MVMVLPSCNKQFQGGGALREGMVDSGQVRESTLVYDMDSPFIET